MKIGAYTICKDEMQFIDRGVEKLKDLDGLFILDTGSTDGTYERLLELVKIYPNLHVRQKTYETFYFDVARNDSLALAYEYFTEGDGLFVLDIDEYIDYAGIEDLRKQLSNAADYQNVMAVFTDDGHWLGRGHRLNKDYTWAFHLHEAVIKLSTRELLFCNKYNIYMNNVIYHHTPDKTKGRNYYQKLKKLITEEPTNSHYVIMALMDAVVEEKDKDYLHYLQNLALDDVSNPTDGHYKDLGWLTFVCYYLDTPELIEKGINVLLQFEPVLIEQNTDYRSYHIILVDLLLKRNTFDKEVLTLIEKEYLGSLRTPQTNWMMEGYDHFSTKQILMNFMMFLYYNKQDYISAAFYAQQLKELENTELNNTNFLRCKDNNLDKRSWVLLFTSNNYIDGVITTIKTLQSTKTLYPISVLVTEDVCIQNIEILLSLNVHVFLVDKIKPVNSGEEVALENLETLDQPGFHAALSKFYIYNLIFFDKVVYLDSDIWVIKNIDDLFEKPNYSAINNNCGLDDLFCSALMVIEPNTDIYNGLLKFFNENYSNRNTLVHDQDVLQQYFKDYWYAHPELQLPLEYCLGTTYYQSGIKDIETAKQEYYFNLLDIKTYHMIYKKPGTHGKKYFEQFKDTDPCYYLLVNRYIELINYCVEQVRKSGLDSPYLVYIR